MGDWTVRDPKVRQTMQSAWLIQDRELRDAVAAQADRHALLLARSAELYQQDPAPAGMLRRLLERLSRLLLGAIVRRRGSPTGQHPSSVSAGGEP